MSLEFPTALAIYPCIGVHISTVRGYKLSSGLELAGSAVVAPFMFPYSYNFPYLLGRSIEELACAVAHMARTEAFCPLIAWQSYFPAAALRIPRTMIAHSLRLVNKKEHLGIAGI